MSLKTLQTKEKTVVQKIEQLHGWLHNNYKSPDRMKVRSDLNALTVELYTIRRQIENLENGSPALGEELPNLNYTTAENTAAQTRKQV